MRGAAGPVLAALAGVALAVSFPEPSLGTLAWVALIPLLLDLRRTTARRGAILGFTFGLVFFGVLLSWITVVGYLAWALLVTLQAVFIGLFGAAWAVASRLERTWARVLAAPALWVAVEFLRTYFPLGGFAWGELAQSQHDAEHLLRIARFGGGWMVAFVVVLANAALTEALVARADRRRWAALVAVAVGVLAGPLLVPPARATGEALRVAIVQGSVPLDFNGSFFEKDLEILSSHVTLTESLAGRGVDLVVWPESSVGIDYGRNPEVGAAMGAAARAAGAPMIVGGDLDAGDDHYLVMAFLVSEEGEVVDRYQKTHLVPFGEYVPARRFLDWIPMLDQVPRDAISADEPVVFDVDGARVAPVISFEGDFGPLVRRRMAEGGRLLVVATNTSTWFDTWASAQHLAFSEVRAAENGVWVVHAALSGTSAFVRPDGGTVERSPLYEPTVLVHDVRLAGVATFYARTGEWFPWLCALGAALAVAAGRQRRGTVAP